MRLSFVLGIILSAAISLNSFAQDTCDLQPGQQKLIQSVKDQGHQLTLNVLKTLDLTPLPDGVSLSVWRVGDPGTTNPAPTDFMMLGIRGTIKLTTGTVLNIRTRDKDFGLEGALLYRGDLASKGTNPDGTPRNGLCTATRIGQGSQLDYDVVISNESYDKVLAILQIGNVELYQIP